MRPTMLLAALALLALLAAPAAPGADEVAPPRVRVLLLDGKSVTGDDAVPGEGRLQVKSAGTAVTVDLADVLEASLAPGLWSGSAPVGGPGGPEVEVDLANRDLVRGVLVRGVGETGFVVRNAALGEVTVPLDQVSAVRFPAALARSDDPPPLAHGEKEDRFVFAGGDRLEGTLRSVDAAVVRIRTSAGAERSLRTDALLGFALAPFSREPETGLRVQLLLVDGSRITGSGVSAEGANWMLQDPGGGKPRPVPRNCIAGMAVRGGRGTALSDLDPASIEVKPFWGDDPLVLPLRPRFDRAFTLDRGTPPPLRLGGRTYLRGVSMFSGTTATWSLEGKGFRTFAAAVGVDDAGPKGAVLFEVLLDGRSAWKSGPLRTVPPGSEPAPVPPLDVSGAKTLSLVVHAGPDDDVQDFADWVKAALIP